jgi:hypothetical protein
LSVLDLSLVKAPYGKGAKGPATIDGWPFHLDPTSVQLPIHAKVQKYRTIGGFVVQVYGTVWGDLTVTGQFGTGGWNAQLGFLDRMVSIAKQQGIQRNAQYAGQNFSPSQPFRFTWPLLGWDFLCYLKAYTSPDGPQAVHMENANINPKYTLTLFIVTDNGSLTEVTKTAYLQRLAPGLGLMWDSGTTGAGSYQGYTQDQYNAPITNSDLQNYINDPGGNGSANVVSATPANLTGPQTTPPASGSTGTGTNVNSSYDFANALLAGLGITPTTVNRNLIRAWECQEGMWSQALLNDGGYPGGWAAWGAPAMNNPLNLGGWTGLGAGAKTTYPPGQNFPVTILNNGSTGATFSFGGNWSNGVAATVYALHNENASWPAIITALSESNPAAFFAAVESWNAGQVDPPYSVRVQNHYDSGDYVNAGY